MEITGEETEKKQPIVSIQDSSMPSKDPIRITRDGPYAKIVVYEKEDLSCEEIYQLLNVTRCAKIDVIKYYEREGCVDNHLYTIYNVLI